MRTHDGEAIDSDTLQDCTGANVVLSPNSLAVWLPLKQCPFCYSYCCIMLWYVWS